MWVLENVLTAEDVQRVRDAVAGAEFQDGKLTAAGAAQVVKNNLQLKRPGGEPVAMDSLLIGALMRHELFIAAVMPRGVSAPMISRYDVGMSYGAHVDSPLIGRGQELRTDVSITLFLASPDEYDGGELMLDTPFGERPVKLPAGHAFCYPTGVLHRVAPVTRGSRLVAVCWAQSQIRDIENRQTLFELNAVLSTLEDQSPQSPHTLLLEKTINNLMRRWVQT
jgi:PKHD-type hydroxylase